MPTVSIIAPLYAKLVMGTEEHLDDTQTVKSIKAAIAKDLGERYADDEQDTLRMASALDPQFKDRPFLSEAEANDVDFTITDAVVEDLTKQQNASTNKCIKYTHNGNIMFKYY